MTLIRTTFTPWQLIDVGSIELAYLLRSGFVYGDPKQLYANFLSHSGGYPVAVSGVTIRITGPTPATTVVVATTAVGVQRVDVGAYRFDWPATDVAAGNYVVTWSAVDADGIATTAVETVTVEVD